MLDFEVVTNITVDARLIWMLNEKLRELRDMDRRANGGHNKTLKMVVEEDGVLHRSDRHD